MRPDEHKKKKNADYKKKHGIQDKNVDKTPQNKTTSKKCTENLSHSPSESDDENAIKRKHFSRRKIESNWARYENEPMADYSPDDDDSTSHKIGEDFQVLLEKSGSQSSHFHFKEEREWEEVDKKVDGSPFSIDLNSLAEALRTIPLQQRLDKKYFEDDELSTEHSREEAIKKVDPVSKHTLNPKRNVEKLSSIQVKHKILSDSNVTEYSNTKNTTTLGKDVHESPVIIDTTESQKVRTSIEKPQMDECSSINCINPASQQNLSVQSQKPSTVDTKEDLEDWLDSILD